MKETVLITGANGFLAKKLTKYFEKKFIVKTLTTNKNNCDNINKFYWNIKNNHIDKELSICDHLVHLAGYPIIKQWNKQNKKLMYSSRIDGAKLLFKYCIENNIKPKTFISASAIGIYGMKTSGRKKEEDITKSDWLSNMAWEWEKAADLFKKIGARVVKMRISLIISKDGLFLKSQLISMRYGLAMILGNKKRMISWIHVEDAVKFISEAIDNIKYEGSYNLATKNPITAEDLTRKIQKILYPYSIRIYIPNRILNILLGERSSIVTSNIIADNYKLEKEGFKYKYHKFEEIINNISFKK